MDTADFTTLKLAVDHSPDGMVIVDETGTIQLINHRYQEITGLRSSDLLGRRIENLIESGMISNSPTLDAIRGRKPQQAVVIFSTNRKLFLRSNPVLDDDGSVLLVITVAQDMDDVQKVEQELRRSGILGTKHYQHLAQIRSDFAFDRNHISVDSKTISVYYAAKKVAAIDAPVFLHGPKGIGKENVARYIHANSNRRDKTFVHIFGNSILDGRSEKELFGYEDEHGQHVDGLLDIVDGGTAYIDELASIPMPIQVKLLDLVHRGLLISFNGAAKKADIRLIIGSTLDEAGLEKDPRINDEWVFVLGTFPINFPPLREKKDDIIPLLNEFLSNFNQQYHTNKKFAQDIYPRLLMYDWPGNIRELKNLVHRAVVISDGDTIELEDLFLQTTQQIITENIDQLPKEVNLKEKIERIEADYMTQALKQYKSARSAAKYLGMDSSTFIRKRQAYVKKGLMK